MYMGLVHMHVTIVVDWSLPPVEVHAFKLFSSYLLILHIILRLFLLASVLELVVSIGLVANCIAVVVGCLHLLSSMAMGVSEVIHWHYLRVLLGKAGFEIFLVFNVKTQNMAVINLVCRCFEEATFTPFILMVEMAHWVFWVAIEVNTTSDLVVWDHPLSALWEYIWKDNASSITTISRPLNYFQRWSRYWLSLSIPFLAFWLFGLLTLDGWLRDHIHCFSLGCIVTRLIFLVGVSITTFFLTDVF